MSTEGIRYPCPVCGAVATLVAPCPGCARAPDPVAAEVIRLDGEIRTLAGRVEQARRTWAEASVALREAHLRRHQVAAQVRAAAPLPTAGLAVPAGQPAAALPPIRPARPETSTRTVQNVLFVLGGLLLGTAAVVFTAVAWATVGVGGRAAILAGITALVLSLPLLAARRGLRATAETFAAVGLLLVILDGYAVRHVDLFGTADLPAARYAAVVCAVTSLTAAGYRLLTRLAASTFAALLAAQPVAVLLAADSAPDSAGWTLVLLATAGLNLLVAWWARGDRVDQTLRRSAWVGYGLALAIAGGCALVALAVGHPDAAPVLAGAPLLAVALVAAGGTALVRHRVLVTAATVSVVVAFAVAAVRAAAELWPSLLLVLAASLATGLALAVPPIERRLPQPVRAGPRIGAMVVLGLLGQVVAVLVVAVLTATVLGARPIWTAGAAAIAVPGDWQLPVAVVVFTIGLAALLPRAARPGVMTVGAAMTLLALPAAAPLPWWAICSAELAAASGLALTAVRHASASVAAVRAGTAAVLGAHAALVSLARPGGATAMAATAVLVGLGVAALGRTRSGPGTWPGLIGGLGLAVAVLAWPAALTAGVFTAGWPERWLPRAAMAAVGLLPVALVAVRRWWPAYLWYAGGAFSGAVLLAGCWPIVSGSRLDGVESPGGYAACGALVLAVGLLVTPTPTVRTVLALSAAILAVPALASTLSALFTVLVAPYAWLGAIWSGAPTGTGGVPDGSRPVALGTAVTLAFLTGAATLSGWWRPGSHAAGRRAFAAALPVAAPGLLVGLAAAQARWPTVPAMALIIGLGCLLGAARVRPGSRLAALAVSLGVPLTGAGLAGALPLPGTTLVALGLTVATGAAIGAGGRTLPVRVSGWLGTVGTGAVLALSASRAAELAARDAAFTVLAVAVLALAAGAALLRRRPAESVTLEAAAHAAAIGAILMTAGSTRYAAAACTLWGVILGIRAVLRHWSPVPVPGAVVQDARVLAALAVGGELLAWWLLLVAEQVAMPEAYTLPPAVCALAAGWWVLRIRSTLSSWLGYGPGLAAALLPSLASILVADGQPVRRLLLGAGALVAVLAGAARRRQAPVVFGGTVLVAIATREMIAVWDVLPRWIYLAVGGLAMIALAMTYERRRRDLGRLRDVVGRMS